MLRRDEAAKTAGGDLKERLRRALGGWDETQKLLRLAGA
jgi:hypothetical protein